MYITVSTDNAMTIVTCFEELYPSSRIDTVRFTNETLYTDQIEKISQAIQSLSHNKTVHAVGIAHTGHIDTTNGSITHASHTLNYEKHTLVADIKKLFNKNIPVYIENDSACAGIAEAYFGKGKDFTTVGVVFLSWGIGGAYIKKIDASYSLFPVDIGHQIIRLNGKECICGQRGCLEAYVGAEAIKKRFLVDQEKLDDLRIWEELVEYIAIGVVNFYTVFTPDILIVSGKTIAEVPYVKETISQKIEERLRRKLFHPIAFSDFHDMGPTIGALALMKIKGGGNSIRVIE